MLVDVEPMVAARVPSMYHVEPWYTVLASLMTALSCTVSASSGAPTLLATVMSHSDRVTLLAVTEKMRPQPLKEPQEEVTSLEDTVMPP